jgi:hypothetical protein
VVGGSNPSGRAKIFVYRKTIGWSKYLLAIIRTADRQKAEFDNLAVFGQVGRCRARRGGGPERSGGFAALPRTISPGAPPICEIEYRLAAYSVEKLISFAVTILQVSHSVAENEA